MINGAGRRFIFLSESLLDKFDVESAGQVIGITSEVRCFIEPAQAANEFLFRERVAQCQSVIFSGRALIEFSTVLVCNLFVPGYII
jgi:hypothetical protein